MQALIQVAQTIIPPIFHFLGYFTPSHLPSSVAFPKYALGVIGIFFLAFIIFALIKTSWLRWLLLIDMREFLSFRAFGVQKFTKDWQKIMARLETANESEYKLAIIEADTMLDDSFKRLGFPGENAPERLGKVSAVILPNINELKIAHGARDNIVHDPNFILSLDQARKILSVYEKAFTDLDLI